MFKRFLKNGQAIFSRPQTNIISAAFIIALLYGTSMILGILRDRLLISRFYACCSHDLDVYWAAFRLPDMIFQLLVLGALSAAFIPVFTEYLLKDKKEAYHIASSLINLLSVIYLSLTLFVFIFAYPLSETITGSFSSKQIDLMVQLTRFMLIAQFFFLLSNFMTGIIQSHQRFLVPALSPILYNLGIIIGIFFLSSSFGIYGPTFGVVIGAFMHFLVQLPLVLKLGSPFSFSFDWHHPGVKEVAKLMLPRTLSLAVVQIESTVDLFLATSLAAGSLTIFYLASHLMQLPVRLVGIPIGQASLPLLAQKRENNHTEFKEVFLSSLRQIFYLVLPATVILLVLRIPVVRLAFGAKGFPWLATVMTGRALAIFSLAIIAQAAIQLLVRGFYALHDTRTPLMVGVMSVVINVALSIFLTFKLSWGILGLATATSMSSFLQVILLFWLLDKKINFDKKMLFNSLFKILLATCATGIFLWIPMRILDQFIFDTTRTLNLAVLTVVVTVLGLTVYFIFSNLLKIEELSIFWNLIKRIGQWKKILVESDEILEPQIRSQN